MSLPYKLFPFRSSIQLTTVRGSLHSLLHPPCLTSRRERRESLAPCERPSKASSADMPLMSWPATHNGTGHALSPSVGAASLSLYKRLRIVKLLSRDCSRAWERPTLWRGGCRSAQHGLQSGGFLAAEEACLALPGTKLLAERCRHVSN